MSNTGVRVAMITSELEPYAKTGGLADVVASLSRTLFSMGVNVSCFLPFYASVRGSVGSNAERIGEVVVALGQKKVSGELWCLPARFGVRVYLIKQAEYFERAFPYGPEGSSYEDNDERFLFFDRAVLEAIKRFGLKFDVLHCHDWQAGLIPALMRYDSSEAFRAVAAVFTIHNISYQGIFPGETMGFTGLPSELFNWRQLEFYGKLNFMKAGIVFSDVATTVSPTYAREVRTPEHGCGLQGVLQEKGGRFIGILNGVDYSVWDPKVDSFIVANYSPDSLEGKLECKRELEKICGFEFQDSPLIGFIGRLVESKGVGLIAGIVPRLDGLSARFVLLGTGLPRYNSLFESLCSGHNSRGFIRFDNALAHKIIAGADILLMPSLEEPCGLNQLYAMRYGTIPLVRRTGGLADTVYPATRTSIVEGIGTGIVFVKPSQEALLNAVRRAIRFFRDRKLWKRLVLNAMAQDWSWERSALGYLACYETALRRRAIDNGSG